MKKKRFETEWKKRQYMEEKDYEIYYYNDHNLSPVRAHSHNYYEIYFFLEGDAEMNAEEQVFWPKPGEVLVIPPGVVHFLRIRNREKPYRRIVLWISASYLEGLLLRSEDYGYLFQRARLKKQYLYQFDPILANQLQGMAFRMIEEQWGDRYGKQTFLYLKLNELLMVMNRMVYEQNHKKVAKGEEEVYQTICNFIASHLEEDLSLERLSNLFFLNKYYISHLFKDKVGMSAHQYITRKRLDACKDAILGDEPIGQICQQFGFSDYTSFYRRFKREYGVSPKEYRQQHQMEVL